MGFFRGLGKFFGSIIFTTFLVLAILVMELVSFTSYSNFKLGVGKIFEQQLSSIFTEQDMTTLQSNLLLLCSQTDKVDLPVGDQSVTLECADIKNSDKAKLQTLIINELIDSVYYKKFDCAFIDCVTKGNLQNLLIVVSNEGNQFYKSLQTYIWIGTAVGLVILLASTETWVGRLKGVGFNLVFTGLPFLLLGYIQSSLVPALPPELESSIKPLIDGLTSSIKNKFIIVLVVGIVLLVAGYALGLYLSRKVGKKKK